MRIASGYSGDCFVGWDVQIETGLLSDPRIRRFYDQIGAL